MEKAIYGTKLGMTQVFTDKGTMIPVTVVAASPMTIVRKKTVDRDGYDALVVAFGEAVKEKRINKPELGLFEKVKQEPKQFVKELKLASCDSFEVGKNIGCDIFAESDIVDVVGTSKGKGFTGPIKLHNQRRLKETHGTGPVVRQKGSMGARSAPGRVAKGMNMAGHWGAERVTVQNLTIVKVDKERNVLLIKGAIPGPNGSLVTVKNAVKK